MPNAKPDSHAAGFFVDVPVVGSTLSYACAIQQACAAVGFDWHDIAPVIDKVREEVEEVQQELNAQPVNAERLKEEIGDTFFALVNLARHAGIDPDESLTVATDKFRCRFEYVAAKAKAGKGRVQQHSLDELEAFWGQAKVALAAEPQSR